MVTQNPEACKGCGLARFFNVAGGITPDQAIDRASMNLVMVREETLLVIDTAIERVGLALLRCAARPDERPFYELKSDAHEIHCVSGTFGFGPLGVAAYMLREYVDVLERRGEWDLRGLQLFHDAFRCLRGQGGVADCQAVLDGLQQLANRHLNAPSTLCGALQQH